MRVALSMPRWLCAACFEVFPKPHPQNINPIKPPNIIKFHSCRVKPQRFGMSPISFTREGFLSVADKHVDGFIAELPVSFMLFLSQKHVAQKDSVNMCQQVNRKARMYSEKSTLHRSAASVEPPQTSLLRKLAPTRDCTAGRHNKTDKIGSKHDGQHNNLLLSSLSLKCSVWLYSVFWQNTE